MHGAIRLGLHVQKNWTTSMGSKKNDFRGEEKESPTPEDPELWLSCEILNVGHWNGSVRRSGLCWLDLC